MKKLYSSILFLSLSLGAAINSKAQPCSGIPVAGVITPDSISVCPGTPVTLTLTGYTQGSGVILQWNQSVPGGGNWSPIAGGTNPVFTATSFSPAIYSVTVTCLNGGGMDNTAWATVIPTCPTADSVWPGDADYNYTVDNYDPLAVAIAFGTTGTPRAGATINWQAEYSADWLTSFASGSNHKHGDCNGDGIIDNNDLTAITNNFGLVHLKGQSTNTYKSTAFPDLYLDMSGINFIPGTTVTISLKFGTSSLPVNAMYGIAGTVIVQGVLPAVAPTIAIDPSWFGTGVNTLEFSKATSTSTIYWAFARTDHQNGAGSGTLGNITIQIPPGSQGQMALHLQDIKLIDNSEAELTDFNVIDDTATIIETGIGSEVSLISSMDLVPNPSMNGVALELSPEQALELRLDITDLTGRLIWTKTVAGMKGKHSITLPAENLPAGVYMVKVSSSTGPVTRTLKLIRQ